MRLVLAGVCLGIVLGILTLSNLPYLSVSEETKRQAAKVRRTIDFIGWNEVLEVVGRTRFELVTFCTPNTLLNHINISQFSLFTSR